MKRIWVALALIIISISLALTQLIIVKSKAEYFLDVIIASEYHFSKKEYSTATELLDFSCEKWGDSEKTLNVFLPHEKVDEIEESLSELKEYAENKEKPEFKASFEKTKRQLLCLKQSELPNFENIM